MVHRNNGKKENERVAHHYEKKRIFLPTSSFTSTITKMAQSLFLIFQPLDKDLTKHVRL